MNPARRLTKSATKICFVLFLSVQLTIATAALFEPRPARWGWQMYSGVKTRAAFTIVRANGDREDVVLTDYLGQPRGDIDLIGRLPGYICKVEPDAVTIEINPPGDEAMTEVRCAR